MKRKSLMRRVLASILCATLVFQNVSVTAYATETVAEPVAEVSGEGTDEEISDEEISEPEALNEEGSDEKTTESKTTEESSTQESSTQESSTEESSTQESSTEESSTQESSTEESSTEESSTQESSTQESSTEESSTQESSEQEEYVIEIVVDENNLRTEAVKAYKYDINTKAVVAQYKEDGNVFADLLKMIKAADTGIVYVEAETGKSSTLKENLVYKWQSAKADGTYADMSAGEIPRAVGKYKLVISLDQKFGKSKSNEINFEIVKRELTIDTSGFNFTKKSGTTVKEIKDELEKLLKVSDSVNKYEWNTYVKSYTIEVKELISETVLADDYVLKKGNDYSISITAQLADAFTTSYSLNQNNTIDLRIKELKKTKLEIVTSVIENEKDITRIYDGNSIAAPTVAAESATPEMTVTITVVDEKDETTNEDRVLEVSYDNLIKTWYDANHNILESAPVNAGVYYYELKYTDETGIYDESKAEVKVVIEPKTIVLKPSASDVDFFVGNTAKDVTSNVAYTLVNTDDTDFTGWDKEFFWGVSYNNPDKPQSYEPVFKLQMGTTTKPEEGKEAVTVWTDVTDEIEIPTGTDENGTKTEYKIVFAGTKGIYTNSGITNIVKANDTSVNSADKNHAVDISAETIEKHAITVTVKASANAVIDTTAMVPNGFEETVLNKDDNLYSKIYDGASVYENRAAYKKAVVKNEAGTELASDTEDVITYTWYEFSMIEDVDDDGNPIYVTKLGNEISDNTEYDVLPNDSGLYALKVSYNDPAHEYVAEDEILFFEIEKQLIKLIPEGTATAYENMNVYDFTSVLGDSVDYKAYKIPGNDRTLTNDKLVEIPELGGEAYRATPPEDRWFGIRWIVFGADNTNKDIAEYHALKTASDVYFNLNISYKLGPHLYYKENVEGNYCDNYEIVVDGNTYKEYTCDKIDITVKPEPEVELGITFDSTKLPKETKEKVYDGKPIDITKAIENGFVIVTNKKTGERIPVTGENAIELNYLWKESGSGEYKEPVNAKKQYLYVSFAGNDDYKPVSVEYDEYFKINPREITITPVLNDVIVAGKFVNSGINLDANVLDNSKAIIEGYIEEDAAVFAYTDSIFNTPALRGVEIAIQNEKNKDYLGYLRTGTKYLVNYDMLLRSELLKDKKSDNYKLVYNQLEFQTNKRGNSEVTNAGYNISNEHIGKQVYTNITYSDLAVNVKPMSGIPYYYAVNEGLKDIDGNKLKPGNYFIVKIIQPAEFKQEKSYIMKNQAVYKNSINKAGGYVINTNTSNTDSIVVAFDAAQPDTGENIRNFDIVWEYGYTESFTIDFREAQLEDDLRTAVAPKTLAFNAVDSKMVVGENQQLDVKLTKYLIDDVISLNYKVISGQDIVSVTDTGYLTALKKGTATVEVYPVKYDNKGNETRIDFKPVTTKITVSDVTAPKAGNIFAYDEYAEVTYTKPADGYRREIYVLEGKGLKPADFELKLADMNQGSFEGHAYIGIDESNYDQDKKLVKTNIKNLKPNTDYTVYVRNVSGIRTNAQDGFVTSSKAGTVKSFKTTKVQIYNLELYFDENQPVVYNEDTDRKEIELSRKSVQVSAIGYYAYKPDNAAADKKDHVEYVLPLDKTQQNTYADPKLNYYVVSSESYITKDNYDNTDEILKKYYGKDLVLIGDRYYQVSPLAKIDKKGNIKLSGTGYIYVIAYDSAKKLISAPYKLYIKSPVTKITAKNISLRVGEIVNLNNYLTFYDGKNKISSIQGSDIPVNVEITSGNCVELQTESNTYYNVVYGTKSNESATVKVSLADNPEVFVNVDIKTKAMNPVKNLKATDVMDNSAVLTFTHDASAFVGAVKYKIEIRDGRNALVSSNVVSIDNMGTDLSKTDIYKGVFGFTYKITGLVRKSDYKVSVSPVYNEETAKAATVKVKTTEMPAWDGPLLGKNGYEGMSITYKPSYRCIDEGYFTSGKMYTFVADMNRPSDYRPTDTLIWKSTDSKVGTIKANSDNATATFTALKQGITTIEVSSKIRKGVIARYHVHVRAAGAAGGTEFEDYEILDFDPYYTKRVEVLTESNPVRVTANDYDYTWVKFTAPADGEYTFNQSGGGSYTYYYKYNPDNKQKYQRINTTVSNTVTLNEGETVYRKARGSFTMTIKNYRYSKLTTTNTVNSKDSRYVVFTAPEDNYYIFSATSANKYASYTIYRSNTSIGSGTVYFKNGDNEVDGIQLSKGDKVKLSLISYSISDSYDISVSSRNYSQITTTAIDTGEINAGEEKWFVFKASVAGNYEFNITDATQGIKAALYTGGISDASADKEFTGVVEPDTPDKPEVVTTAADSKDYVCYVTLSKDDTVAVRVWFEENANAGEDEEKITSGSAKINVSLPMVAEIKLDETKEITVNKGEEAWVSFVVDETNAKYLFDVYGANASVEYYKNSVSSKITLTNKAYKNVNKGDVIYIRLKSTTDSDTKMKMLVSKAAATEIKLNDVNKYTFKHGKEYFYSFTAPAYGLYTFKTDVLSKTGVNNIYAYKYNDINDLNSEQWSGINTDGSNRFYKEVMLAAGTKVVFAMKVLPESFDDNFNPIETEVEMSVSQITATELPDEITLSKDNYGEVKWYRFTAKSDDTYTIKMESKTGEKYVSGLNGLANVNFAAFISDTTTNVPDTVELSAGQSVFFRVINQNTDSENSAKIKIAVTGTESLVEEIPSSSFTLEASETKLYKFTAINDSKYQISFKSGTEGITPSVRWATSYNGTYNNVVNNSQFNLKQGQVYYFRVNNPSSEKKISVTLNVAEVIVTEIKDEVTTVKVSGENSQWYVYKVPASGRYSITVETQENGSKYSDIEFYDSLTGEMPVSDLSEKWIDTPKEIYIRIINSDTETKSLKITVKAISAETITANTEKEITLEKNESKWYKLTADEETVYSFVKTIPDEMRTETYYYVNTNNDKMNFQDSGYVSLKKGDSILIKVRRTDNADASTLTAKIAVNKETIMKIETGKEYTITKKLNNRQFVCFTPEKDAYYAIGLKDVPENVTVESNLSSIEYTIEYNVSKRYIGVSEIFYVTPELDEETEENKNSETTFKIYVEEIKPAVLTMDGADVTVAKNQKAWFDFEAPEDGVYTFTDDCTVEDINYGIYKYGLYTKNITSGGMSCVQYRMNKGEKISIAFYYKYNELEKIDQKVANSTSFKVSVKNELKSMSESGATTDVEAGKNVWYSYTAPKTGEYKFANDNGNMYIHETITRNVTLSQNVKLRAGDIVFIRLGNTGSDKISVKVNVTVNEMTDMAAEGVTKSLGAGEYVWYSYTAAKTGEYIFANETGTVSIYKDPLSNTTSSNTLLLEEGSVIYIKVENNSSEKQEIKVNVTVNEALTLKKSAPLSVSFTAEEIENKITYKWIAFTSLKTGYYKFAKANVNGNMSAYYNGNTISGEYFITKGKTVYIKVTASEAALATVSVTNGKDFHYETIVQGQPKYADLDSYEVAYYEFTAPKTGTYTFYSTDSEAPGFTHDSKAYLYDDKMKSITSDDDSGEGSNFLISHKLTKGQTVYLKVRPYSEYLDIEFWVHVELN